VAANKSDAPNLKIQTSVQRAHKIIK
jgi:hypothetical protein